MDWTAVILRKQRQQDDRGWRSRFSFKATVCCLYQGNTWEKAVRKHGFCKMPLWKCFVKIFIHLQRKLQGVFVHLLRSFYSRQISPKTKIPCRFSKTKGDREDSGSGLGLLSSAASS